MAEPTAADSAFALIAPSRPTVKLDRLRLCRHNARPAAPATIGPAPR